MMNIRGVNTVLVADVLREPDAHREIKSDPYRWVRFEIFGKGSKVDLAIRAALLLSVSSFATTFIGIANFHFHWILAFISALGIQILLYISSWMYAEARANLKYMKRLDEKGIDEHAEIYRQARSRADGAVRLLSGLMVLFTMTVSVFFSFDALFDAVYKPEQQKLTNIKVARSDMGGIFEKLRDKVEEERQAELQALRQDEAWTGWRSGLDKILEAAQNSRKIITKASEDEKVAAESGLANARDATRQKAEEVAKLEAQSSIVKTKGFSTENADSAGADAQSVRSDAEITRVQRSLEGLRREISAWEAKIKEETEAGGLNPDGTRRIAACGKICKEFERERRAVNARLTVGEAELQRLQSESAQLKAQRESQLASSKTIEAQFAAAKSELNALQAIEAQRQADFDRVIKSLSASGDPADSGGVIDQVRNGANQFQASGRTEPFKVITDGCLQIYKVLAANPSTRALVTDVSCDTDGFAPRLEKLARLDNATQAFQESCKVDDAFNALDDVKPMVDKARTCIGLSTLSFDTLSAERSLVDRVEQENSPSTSHFERSLATLVRFDKLAWLAAFIAFVIDFMIIGSALVGATSLVTPLYSSGHIGSSEDLAQLDSVQHVGAEIHPNDPVNIRNQKLILRALTLQPGDSENADLVIDLESSSVKSMGDDAARALAVQMNSFAAKGFVRPAAGKHFAYILESSFIEHIASEIGKYEKAWEIRNPDHKLQEPPKPANESSKVSENDSIASYLRQRAERDKRARISSEIDGSGQSEISKSGNPASKRPARYL